MFNEDKTYKEGPSPTERIAERALPEDQNLRQELVLFIESLPQLPTNPKEAFFIIRKHLMELGFVYDNHTFSLKDVIEKKKGNCLGLAILFGIILQNRGFNVKYEIVVNAHDAYYRNDLKEFSRLIHGDVFPFDSLPDLPADKVDYPQNRFVPLEHPVLIIDGDKFEVTSLSDEDDESFSEHTYSSELSRVATLENLVGMSFVSTARIIMHDTENPDIDGLTETVRKGLSLGPNDPQGWLLLSDLASHSGLEELSAEAMNNFKNTAGDDSLSNFSLYQLTSEERFLDRALELYPAFLEAWMAKNIRPPFKTEEEKLDARFNLTVASICVANSVELEPLSFYSKYRDLYVEVFGEEYVADLLEDIKASD